MSLALVEEEAYGQYQWVHIGSEGEMEVVVG